MGDDEVRDTEDFGLIQHDGCEIQAPYVQMAALAPLSPTLQRGEHNAPRSGSQAEESESSRVVQGRKHRDVQILQKPM